MISAQLVVCLRAHGLGGCRWTSDRSFLSFHCAQGWFLAAKKSLPRFACHRVRLHLSISAHHSWAAAGSGRANHRDAARPAIRLTLDASLLSRFLITIIQHSRAAISTIGVSLTNYTHVITSASPSGVSACLQCKRPMPLSQRALTATRPGCGRVPDQDNLAMPRPTTLPFSNTHLNTPSKRSPTIDFRWPPASKSSPYA